MDALVQGLGLADMDWEKGKGSQMFSKNFGILKYPVNQHESTISGRWSYLLLLDVAKMSALDIFGS